jgi:aminodeoxyfutalosine synthase
LADIDDKLQAHERLTLEDGVRLFESPDLLAVGHLANRERERLHGARTYFNYNLRLEPTNVCEATCPVLLVLASRAGDAEAYTMTLEQAWDKLRQRADQPLTEVHVVNGLNPHLPFSYYTDLLRGFKRIRPRHPPQVLHGRGDRLLRRSLHHDRRAGDARADGGGPRLAAGRRRRDLRAARAPEDQRRQGRRGSLSVDSRDRAPAGHEDQRHDALRAHRDDAKSASTTCCAPARCRIESGGFQAFIPLAFHPDNNQMRKLPAPTGTDTLQVHAVSRLMLDNIPHIKAFWIATGWNWRSSRCGSASTISTAPCRKRRSTTWPVRRRPRA